jgi:hypothetical protein
MSFRALDKAVDTDTFTCAYLLTVTNDTDHFNNSVIVVTMNNALL